MAGPAGLTGPAAAAGGHAAGTARRATIHDVAKAAGVSRQTVTRAVNDMPGISAATRERVLEAARTLAYRPSRFGRGLVKAEHHTLGLVIQDLTNPYYPELAAAVVGYAAEAGWNVLLADVVVADDREELVARLARQVDAVVGYGIPAGSPLLDGLPVVQVDPVQPPPRGAVHLDVSQAMADGVDRLVFAGVRRPLLLDVCHPDQPSGRMELASRRFAEHGVPVQHRRCEPTTASGAEAMAPLLDDGPEPDAVVTFNDSVALGVLTVCLRRGRAVPDAVRILGVDGLSMGAVVTPQLTTLAIDLGEVARHAVELALGMQAGLLPRSGPDVQRTVRHRLLVRETA